jgi:hypothetical protein
MHAVALRRQMWALWDVAGRGHDADDDLAGKTVAWLLAGRSRTSLVEGMLKQVALVCPALVDEPKVPVRGVLCLVDADWPLIGGAFTVIDVAVLWPEKLKALLTEPGVLDSDQIADLQWQLHEAFPRQKQAPPAT